MIEIGPVGLEKKIVNVFYGECTKTKVVIEIVFLEVVGKIHSNEEWSYSGENVEIVDQFVYLGVMFNFYGKCFVTKSNWHHRVVKRMFALKSTLTMKELYLNHCTLLSLFDTYVNNNLNYGCEVWGSNKGSDVEKVHL